MSDLVFKCFSDAGSFNNGKKNPDLPAFAAAGVVITLDEKVLKKGSKLFDNQTISYGELKASILVLDLLKKRILDQYPDLQKPYKIELYSDSQFVVKSVNEWMNNWLKKCNDWKTDVWYNASGNEVGQYKLFRELKLKYLDNPDYDIKFIHVKGHTGKNDFLSKMNDLCDNLATQELKKRKQELGLK